MLRAWNAGDESALERLTPIVYAELHRLAQHQMRGERDGHILQPSALVNEAFLRLAGDGPVEWANRNQFFAVAARLMRQILIDFARTQMAAKRGARAGHVNLADLPHLALHGSGLHPAAIVDLHDALDRLAALDARQAQVVELRFFGGLGNTEIAAVLGTSEPTVVRDWRLARVWLYEALSKPA